MEKQNSKTIYLENKSILKGLLVEIHSEISFTLDYSKKKAIKFSSFYKARKFIKENNLKAKFKPVLLNN